MPRTISAIKVFGERHTATNAVSRFILENWEVDWRGFEYLGWKHRIAPRAAEWQKKAVDDVLFVVMVRNPYTWLKAMHRRPYTPHQPGLVTMDFSDFVQFPIEDYENACCLWNYKNRQFLNFLTEVPNCVMLRIEDFVVSQKSAFEKLRPFFEGGEFKPFDKYADGFNHEGALDRSKLVKEVLHLPEIDTKLNEIINSFIDYDVLRNLGYYKEAYCRGQKLVLGNVSDTVSSRC